MSFFAAHHDKDHGDRQGADTRYIEVCYLCADAWLTYVQEHPEERPGVTVVLAKPPGWQD